MLVDVVFLGNHYKISDQLKIRVALTMLNVNLTRELRYKMTNFNFKLHNWEDLEGIIDKYATDFEIYSSYIVSDSNLVDDNPYVNQFREMFYVLKSYYNNAVKEIDQAGSQAIDQAKAQAASTITGPGFGVITNSVSSMIAYDLVSNAAVNKQEKKATEELYKLVTYIKQQAEEQLNELGKSLGSNYFLKSEDLIENIGNYMQTLTESLLVKYGQMNQEELDQYDPETSQRILDQKKDENYYYEAFLKDPSNLNIYGSLIKYHKLDKKTAEIPLFLGIENLLLPKLYQQCRSDINSFLNGDFKLDLTPYIDIIKNYNKKTDEEIYQSIFTFDESQNSQSIKSIYQILLQAFNNDDKLIECMNYIFKDLSYKSSIYEDCDLDQLIKRINDHFKILPEDLFKKLVEYKIISFNDFNLNFENKSFDFSYDEFNNHLNENRVRLISYITFNYNTYQNIKNNFPQKLSDITKIYQERMQRRECLREELLKAKGLKKKIEIKKKTATILDVYQNNLEKLVNDLQKDLEDYEKLVKNSDNSDFKDKKEKIDDLKRKIHSCYQDYNKIPYKLNKALRDEKKRKVIIALLCFVLVYVSGSIYLKINEKMKREYKLTHLPISYISKNIGFNDTYKKNISAIKKLSKKNALSYETNHKGSIKWYNLAYVTVSSIDYDSGEFYFKNKKLSVVRLKNSDDPVSLDELEGRLNKIQYNFDSYKLDTEEKSEKYHYDFDNLEKDITKPEIYDYSNRTYSMLIIFAPSSDNIITDSQTLDNVLKPISLQSTVFASTNNDIHNSIVPLSFKSNNTQRVYYDEDDYSNDDYSDDDYSDDDYSDDDYSDDDYSDDDYSDDGYSDDDYSDDDYSDDDYSDDDYSDDDYSDDYNNYSSSSSDYDEDDTEESEQKYVYEVVYLPTGKQTTKYINDVCKNNN